jgi:hypothetical protein
MSDRCPCGGCGMDAAPYSSIDIPLGETSDMAQVRRIIGVTRAEQRKAQGEASKLRSRIHQAEMDVKALRSVYVSLREQAVRSEP